MMIHYRNGIPSGEKCEESKGEGFENRYLEILQKAKKEYAAIPTSKYYKDEHNLYVLMETYVKNDQEDD